MIDDDQRVPILIPEQVGVPAGLCQCAVPISYPPIEYQDRLLSRFWRGVEIAKGKLRRATNGERSEGGTSAERSEVDPRGLEFEELGQHIDDREFGYRKAQGQSEMSSRPLAE